MENTSLFGSTSRPRPHRTGLVAVVAKILSAASQ